MRQIKSIKTKLLIRIILSFVVLSIVIQAIVFVSFRNFSMDTSKERALSAAELIRDTITSFMMLGVYDKRDIFLDRIKNTSGLKEIKILRGKAVIQQFGQSNRDDKPPTFLEKEVLKSGDIKSAVSEGIFNVEYAIVIPYKADNGRVNCLQCHKAARGEVLGVVSLVVDITGQRRTGLSIVSYMVVVSMLFSIGTLYIIYVFFKPYTELFHKLRLGFEHAAIGDFSSHRVDAALSDEAGDVARGFNTMTENLSATLSSIDNKVSLLIGYQTEKTANALKDTTKTVEMLVKIYNFKRTIEKDAIKTDVFLRIGDMLMEMGIANFSVYEVSLDKTKIKKVISKADNEICPSLGQINKDTVSWCKEVIFTDPVQCRAVRTGAIVDSREFSQVCPNFMQVEEGQTVKFHYYCIPINIGGHTGDVVQIVSCKDCEEPTASAIPYIKAHLKECEPVLEGKTFMELLKAQSLIDQLTGLYNRRYLDEITNSLCSAAVRRGTLIGILMIDIDHFKQVNDTHGHGVGDTVLKQAASVIVTSVRESDIVIRYGGEEILVLLVDATEGKSVEVAQKIRRNIETESIETPTVVLKITVSIGVSEFPKDSDKFWPCQKHADTALYKAKHEGRNRVCVHNKGA
ncbi:diguanylate cyclase [Candidatus Magnetominusculus dajiuhuensis]|uniref:diguanylate cyclase n=1 Tax=Candidatus Magnetominusculus dajiuhuensis TaxID=3137712 RepID=UPI003B439197